MIMSLTSARILRSEGPLDIFQRRWSPDSDEEENEAMDDAMDEE